VLVLPQMLIAYWKFGALKAKSATPGARHKRDRSYRKPDASSV